MEYITTREAAAIWQISERRVRMLCQAGRIPGAVSKGRFWMIPELAAKPADHRISHNRKQYPEKLSGIERSWTEITQLKNQLDCQRPLPAETISSLHENLVVNWTYHSNAIEGNTLTLAETRVVLEGLTIGGKSLREHLEIINHRDAIAFIDSLVQKESGLTEWDIRNIHYLVLKEIDPDNAGKYRTANVLISGATHRPPAHYLVPEQINILLSSYQGAWQKYHPLVRAALLHGEFVKIHPFIDGNGRTARLLLNFELMKAGYPPLIIRQEMRPRYYDALDKAHTQGNYCDFLDLVIESEKTALRLWLDLAT